MDALLSRMLLVAWACAVAGTALGQGEPTEPRRPGPTEFDDCAAAGWCPAMVVVPRGRFVMGSPDTEAGRHDDEGPRRSVQVATFAMSKYPVTRAQWKAFAAATGLPATKNCAWGRRPDASWEDAGFAQEEDHPVICVSWSEAQAYVQWLSRRTGHRYRLPTEAEFEYAARAGSATTFPWGPVADHEYANYGSDDCCSPRIAGRDRWEFTSPVDAFPPNAFGLHDMVGQVNQWVQDCYAEDYRKAPTDGSAYQPSDCPARIARGGCWNDVPAAIRPGARNYAPPDPEAQSLDSYRSAGFGVRVVRDL